MLALKVPILEVNTRASYDVIVLYPVTCFIVTFSIVEYFPPKNPTPLLGSPLLLAIHPLSPLSK